MMKLRTLYSTILVICSFSAHATLVTVDNGLGVYDNVLNVTWTQDANLLATMETNPTAYGYADQNSLLTAIINASDGIHYGDNATLHNLSMNDFNAFAGTNVSSMGLADFWGQQAFVHFLNAIDYAGSTHWALPTVVDNFNALYGVWATSSTGDLGELYAGELGYGPGGIFANLKSNYGNTGNIYGSKDIPPFSNVQSYNYAYGTLAAASGNTDYWSLNTENGSISETSITGQTYLWALTPGQLGQSDVTLPVPSAVWLFGSGLLGLFALKRRGYAI